jgi:hypothetical protein
MSAYGHRRGLIRNHPLIGREVEDAQTGEFIGRAERGETFRYRGATPPVPVTRFLRVRHTRGDGQARLYEPSQVREHVTEGRVLPRRALRPGRSTR